MIRHVGEASGPPVEALLDADELRALAAFGVTRAFPQEELIFARGAAGDSMFAVIEGEVELVFAGGRRKTLGPGVFFGELALLLAGEGRSADAHTRPGTRLLEVDAAGFERLVHAHPPLAMAVLTRRARALLGSERRLVGELEARNRELERALDFLRRTREELSSAELQAQTDELTGLYNRRCLNAQAPRLIERAEATGFGLAVILIDLDRFKEVNDTHGHPGGDAVLRAVGATLRASVRWSDLPCRIGGDEFTVVLADILGRAAAVGRAREIFRTVSALNVELGGVSVQVGSSHGGALLRPGETLDELLRRADDALYAAKARGRGSLVWEGEPLASTSA